MTTSTLPDGPAPAEACPSTWLPTSGAVLGKAFLTIQDHADSENPPPPRVIECQVLEIPLNDDGTATLPNGQVVRIGADGPIPLPNN